MKRAKRAAHAFVLVIALFAAFVVSGGAVVNAASDYDDVLKTTGVTRVSNHATFVGGQPPDNCSARDVSASWGNILTTQSYWDNAVYGNGTTFTEITSALNTALSNGTGWAVMERTAQNSGFGIGNYGWVTGDHLTQIVFTPSNTNSVDFVTISGRKYAYMHTTDSTPLYTVIIGVKEPTGTDTCQIGVAVVRKIAGNTTPYWMMAHEHLIGSNSPGDISSWKQLFVNSPINYPSGYAGELMSTTAPPVKYVAMGDSFSSGEGNAPFESGTDTSDVNECHRSPQAYPRLLLDELSLRQAFVACSGATTHNVLYGGSGEGAWNEPPQVDALSADTEVVTITVGGNNVGFKYFAEACVTSDCGIGTSIYNSTLSKIANVLPYELEDTYDTILQQAPNAQIYVLGYPHVTPAQPPNPFPCSYLEGTPNSDPYVNALAAHHVTNLLNGAVETGVDEARVRNNTGRITYISMDGGTSPFTGHDVCSSAPYFINLTLPQVYIFHPNQDGQIAYRQVVQGAMS